MRTIVRNPSFEQVLGALRDLQFDVRKVPGVANRIFLEKYGAGAILAPSAEPRAEKGAERHAAVWIHHPGWIVAGEVATLVDRGHQKFWKSTRLELPAMADSLRVVHRFSEELRAAIGEPNLYNESLGTTSDVYLYDRVQGRDLPEPERPRPAWDPAPGIR